MLLEAIDGAAQVVDPLPLLGMCKPLSVFDGARPTLVAVKSD